MIQNTNSVNVYHVSIPFKGTWLTPDQIRTIEKKHNVKFMGSWLLPETYEYMLDVFFNPYPKEGEAKYFGLYEFDDEIYKFELPDFNQYYMTGVLDIRTSDIFIPKTERELEQFKGLMPTIDVMIVGGDFIPVGRA